MLADIWKAARAEKPRVRIWSAACSTGEEPYSIAMTAMASRREAGREWDFRVLATDLDTSVLHKAMTGHISVFRRLEEVPAAMRESSFETQRTAAFASHRPFRPSSRSSSSICLDRGR